ncbi:PREDICTED: calponin homology domain-containing protein DDB_G0272472-like isoform X2 [Lupinus angustifolius]|uniref:calponin homology domain-containing protein DDB_G0272472-like isoform X2 n=1 Tax=Lupinus angustifolius TaxID=3871 RepID=UPI00092F3C2D|nr:PREDICTED: calponin homology domain-containing protein DDB_G0272472-like isoform X2 [Lupinus angustifolius]
MTDLAVVNLHGEISEQHGAENGEDQQKVKVGGDCNGGSHVTTTENGGDVGGKIQSDGIGGDVGRSGVVVTADGGSTASDLVAVIDDNGDGGAELEGLKVVDGESQVTVLKVAESEAEGECDAVHVDNKESDYTDDSVVSNSTAKEEIPETEINNGEVLVDAGVDVAGVSADLESVTILDASGDVDVAVVEVGVKDLNKIHDHNQDEEIKSGAVISKDVQDGVMDRELSEQAVENGNVDGVTTVISSNVAVDAQSGVEDEIHGDTIGVVHNEVGFHNSMENKIHGDSNGVTVTDAADEVGLHGSVENEIHGDSNKGTITDANDDASVHSSVENHHDSNGDTIADANGEVDVHSSVENEIHGDSNGDIVADSSEVGVEDSVDNEIHDDVKGVDVTSAAEVLGDEKDVVTVLEGVEDENKSHGDFESVAAENGLAVKSDVPVVVDAVSARDVEECADEGDQVSSGEKVQIESIDSGGGDEKDGGTVVQEGGESISETDVDKGLECKSIASTDVSDEKDIVTNQSHGESESVVADVQNGLEDTNLSECAEKNAVSVYVDNVSATTDVKESADEFVQNGLEKAQLESVSDVEKSEVTAYVNGLAEPELSGYSEEKENPVEGEVGSKPKSSEGEKLLALNSTDMTTDDNVISDIKNITVESKAEPSNSAVENKGEPLANISDMKNNVVQSETEPLVQGEISVEGEGGNHAEGDSIPTQEGSTTADSIDGQNVGSEVVRTPFYYLIRIPRYDDDENIQEQIENALKQVDEKTDLRAKIRAEINSRKDICNECLQDFRAAKSAEQTARNLLKSKRQEMDSVKSTMNRLNNVISVADIDNKIRNMEHMIQHETLPLNEEKQLIRQIKQLKQSRGELSSIIGKQDQSQQSTDQDGSIEEHTKRSMLLKKEFDLLRNNLLKAETVTKAAKDKYDDEWDKLSVLQGQFNVADNIRQEAYTKLRALKSQLHEKKKYFWEYKGAVAKGQDLAAEGKKEELQCFCIDQVERIMELWNKDDEFRKDYIRCNTRSTVRRLQTLDGRALGPDEQPPVIPNAIYTERASKNKSQIMQSTPEQEKKPTESVDIKDEPVTKVVVQNTEKSQTSKAKKPAKPATVEKSPVVVSRWGDEPDEPEDTIEEPVRTKEEEELILNAEKARRESEAEKLKEKRRQEEIEKAKEAMERKKRNAEKAQQRAAVKAQKEAEQKEKEREKKARKKERRRAATTDNAENAEHEPTPTSETLTRSIDEIDQSDKPVEVAKKPQKPSHFAKQTKSKSVPLPLRNRGKRRIQPWMWWALIAVLIAAALFYTGNNSPLRSWLQSFF